MECQARTKAVTIVYFTCRACRGTGRRFLIFPLLAVQGAGRKTEELNL